MLPDRYTQIDELTRPAHSLLEATDRCFYLGEYTANAGFSTPTNQLIINYKISPTQLVASPARRRHKENAITEIAAALTKHFSGTLSPGTVVVPIPPSKACDHPNYDSRLVRTLERCRAEPRITFHQLIKQRVSTAADHEIAARQTYHQLYANCYIDEPPNFKRPAAVLLFDDLLTSGKHFKVCQRHMHQRYGKIPVVGFFVARRIHRNDEIDFERFFPHE